jgi:diapolycopene oxygenase
MSDNNSNPSTTSSNRTLVIGAGFGGLGAALYLADKGRDVCVVDKRSGPGGKAYSFVLGDYRFDAGPSLFTLRNYFEELFSMTGAVFSDYVETVPLDPITHYFFADGSRINSRPAEGFLDEVDKIAPEDRKGMKRYLYYSKHILDISEDLFLKNPLSHWKEGGPKKAVANLMKLGGIDVFRTMHRANSRFVKDPRLVQLLDRFATYNGSNPYLAPAALNCIAWVEHGQPVYALRNGIASIPEALEKRCRELGVRFEYDREVQLVAPESRRTGSAAADGHLVRYADGSFERYRSIVSDVDILRWYEDLVGEPERPAAQKYRRQPSSSSAVVFFWGIREGFDELGLHNIFFSSDYRREFDDIHKGHRLPEYPTVYVNIGSKFTPEDAPSGGENWFVMVNAPHHEAGRDWATESSELRNRVIRRLSKELGRDIGDLIDEERILTPDIIEDETGSYRGSLYGISSNTMTAAFGRHKNRSPYYPGIYHCGGSVHPGGGMPLALSSGMIAARLLLEDDNR